MNDEAIGFLVAGVQKAGTSALFSYLAEHPQLQPPAAKELHLFDGEGNGDRASLQAAIACAFPPADGRMRFEATPITLYWPGALERVRAYNADMRLVVILRDPAMRAFSHWRMETARGLEDRSFDWCIRQGRGRFLAAHRVQSYVERGFYGAQLRRALALFPRHQILLVASADLAERPAECLAQVTRFLGVSELAGVRPRRVRPETPPAPGLPHAPSPRDRAYLDLLYQDDQRLLASLV